MNALLSRIIGALICIFVIVYIGYQAFVWSYDPYEAQIVKEETYVKDVDIEGFFVRDESVIDVDKTGVINYRYENAQKIPRGSSIADVYSHQSDLLNLKKVEVLETQKKILEGAQNKDVVEGSKLDLLNNRIGAMMLELVKSVDNNNLSEIDSVVNELMLNMDKIAVCVNTGLNFDDTIAELTREIDTLRAKISEPLSSVVSDNSGYFSNNVDGYETIFTPNMIGDLTVNQVEAYLANQREFDSTKIGKLSKSSNWYYVSLVDIKDIEEFSEGQTVTLKFNSKSTREIKVQVDRIIKEPNAKKSIVVFKNSILDENIISMRFEKAKVTLKSYNGIVIPKECIRIQKVPSKEDENVMEEVKGVYVLFGKNARFRKVDLIYEDDYVLISKPSAESGYVSVYDQVIIKGRALQ